MAPRAGWQQSLLQSRDGVRSVVDTRGVYSLGATRL